MFKSCWDWIILLATFYVAVVVPYNASFVTAERPSAIIDVLVEALFFIGEHSDKMSAILLITSLVEFTFIVVQQF